MNTILLVFLAAASAAEPKIREWQAVKAAQAESPGSLEQVRLVWAVTLRASDGAKSVLVDAESGRVVEAPGLGAEREDYEKRAKEEIDALDGKIAELEKRIDQTSKDARKGAEERLAKLEKQRKEARAELSRLLKESGKSWGKLRKSLDRTLADLRAEYEDLLERLKKKE